MKDTQDRLDRLTQENDELRLRLQEAEETLDAIRGGEVDALVVDGAEGRQVFSLRGTDHTYRVMIEEMREGAVTLAEDGSILYANRFMETLLHIPLEKIVGDSLAGFVHPADLPSFNAIRQRCGHGHASGEIRLRTPENGSVPVYMSAAGIALEGMPICCTTLTDLSEQKRQERILAEARLNRSIIETAMDGFWMADADGRLLEVNETYCKMSGYTAAELLSMRISDVEATEDERMVAAHKERIAALGSDRFESRHRRKDGTMYDVEVSVQYRREDDGRFIAFLRDITERKAMEIRIHQAQKMESIGTLAGGIAHDFNNILSPIVGISELLLDDLKPGGPEYENVQEILKAGQRGSDLVKQILAFSRRTEHRMLPIRLQPVLQEVLKLTRSTIPADIDIRWNIDRDCGKIMADPVKMHQIAMNLITNAYHAVAESSGNIHVALTEIAVDTRKQAEKILEPGRYAKLTVTDNGCGMDPATMAKIFEPYFTTKAQGKGTGLGLAVVFGIVKEHGGDIHVDSAPGKGSTFSVYLPVAPASAERAPAGTAKRPPGDGERILLVDDEAAIVRFMKQMLERLGYDVTERCGSVEALKTFAENPGGFDLVVSDMNMPNMTGTQLAWEMIAIRPDIPIILCTGFSERIDPEKAAAIGIKNVIMKPVVRSEMAETVRKTLDETGAKPPTGRA